MSGKGGSDRASMSVIGNFCLLQVRANAPCYRSDDRFLLLLPFPQRARNLLLSMKVFFISLLILAGDVEENPGPDTDMAIILQQLQKGQSAILSKLDDIEKRQTRLDSLISDFGTRIESLESKMQTFENVERDTSRVYNQVRILSENADDMVRKLDDLENRGRRLNLVFYGIEDREPRESWEASENLVRAFCQDRLQITFGEVQRAHRIGKYGPNYNRPIIVNFASYKDTEKILSNGRKLKGSNYGVSRDFSPRVREIRRRLWAVGKARKQNGQDKVSLVHDKLIINGDAHGWDDITESVIKLNKQ